VGYKPQQAVFVAFGMVKNMRRIHIVNYFRYGQPCDIIQISGAPDP
jgi:hypothetical protein